MQTQSICFGLMMLLLISCCVDAQDIENHSKLISRGNWYLTTIEGKEYDGFVGKYASIILDANNYPHISYYDEKNQDLKYAHWDGKAWQITTVDGLKENVGWNTSIALDSKGNPHIAYDNHTDSTNKKLRYAFWDGINWKIQEVPTKNDVDGRIHLIIDIKDTPHIGYCEHVVGKENRLLSYAFWDGSNWKTQSTDLGIVSDISVSMDLDSNNWPHFCYYHSGKIELYYTYFDLKSGQWIFNLIEQAKEPMFNTSIVLDIKNMPHVSYTSGKDPTYLKYAVFDGKTWIITVVDQGKSLQFNNQTSIAIDSAMCLHLCYGEGLFQDLRYAYSNTGGKEWQIQILDRWGQVGSFACMALDTKNYPHIAYLYQSEADLGCEICFGALRYAYVSDDPAVAQGWQFSTVDFQGLDAHCGYVGSMVLDTNNYAHIVYCQEGGAALASSSPFGEDMRATQFLKYACWDGSVWKLTTLDKQDGIYTQSSIAIDLKQMLHVSYGIQTAAAGNFLMYASNSSGAWKLEKVIEGTCGATAIALDQKQLPHIAYCDEKSGYLYYTYWDGASWKSQAVDGPKIETFAAGTISIAVDSQNFPHISYFDKNNEVIKYARWNGKEWQRTVIDKEPQVGLSSSIKIGTGDTVHISYTGSNSDIKAVCDLKYAYWNGLNWTITIVDKSSNMYGKNSLVLDSYGNPHISYQDYRHQDLKYAYFDSATRAWVTSGVDSAGPEGTFNSIALDGKDQAHISYVYKTDSGVSRTLKYASYINTNNMIQLKLFAAKMEDQQVLVYWETAAEVDNAGFYIWRSNQQDGLFTRLNDTLIPSEGGSTWGAFYSYYDPAALHGQTYYYKLEDVDYQGISTFHGPIHIDVQK